MNVSAKIQNKSQKCRKKNLSGAYNTFFLARGIILSLIKRGVRNCYSEVRYAYILVYPYAKRICLQFIIDLFVNYL